MVVPKLVTTWRNGNDIHTADYSAHKASLPSTDSITPHAQAESWSRQLERARDAAMPNQATSSGGSTSNARRAGRPHFAKWGSFELHVPDFIRIRRWRRQKKVMTARVVAAVEAGGVAAAVVVVMEAVEEVAVRTTTTEIMHTKRRRGKHNCTTRLRRFPCAVRASW